MSYKDHDWSDVDPIPVQNGDQPVATIAYTPAYAEATSYLRAVMAADERTQRALDVTTAVVEENAAHYTAWEYRRRILKALHRAEDLEWLDEMTLENHKNYQIWNHRETMLQDFAHEHAFCQLALSEEPKNYHAWSYLQAIIRGRLGDAETAGRELEFVNQLLDDDVRNNSAWNYRYFVLDNSGAFAPAELDGTASAEKAFVGDKISLAPSNESPWNYITGIYRTHLPSRLVELEDLASSHSCVAHALELLATIHTANETTHDQARKDYERLEQLVPIRRGYWRYKQSQLMAGSTAASF